MREYLFAVCVLFLLAVLVGAVCWKLTKPLVIAPTFNLTIPAPEGKAMEYEPGLAGDISLVSYKGEYLKVPPRVHGQLQGAEVTVFLYKDTEYDSYRLMFNNGSRSRDITENGTEELTFRLGIGWHTFRLELYRDGKVKKIVERECEVR